MTHRIRLDDLTSNQLDQLDALRAVARGYCPHCGRGDAAPTVHDWEQQRKRAERAEGALARVRALADRIRQGAPWTANHDNLADRIHAAIDEPTPDQPAALGPLRTHRQQP